MAGVDVLKLIFAEENQADSDDASETGHEDEEAEDNELAVPEELPSEEEDNVEINDDETADEFVAEPDEAIEEDSGNSDEPTSQQTRVYKSKSGYVWQAQPLSRRRAPAHNIVKENCSLKESGHVASILDAFALFLKTTMKDLVVMHTNQKAEEYYHKWNVENNDNKVWNKLEPVELDAFIGLLLYAGVLLSGRESVNELWKMEDCGRAVFRATMGIVRFKAIMQFLRFDDLTTRMDRRKTDKLAPFRELLNMFTATLQNPYTPGPCLTVDEQLVPYRGRCPFRQYMPSKPAKYGLKWWLCCDAENSYVCNLSVYIGKQQGDNPAKNVGQTVVTELVGPYRGSGRNITTDNYFTSVPLAEELLQHNITLVGTMRKNKTEIPPEFLPSRQRSDESSVFGFNGYLTLVSYVPKKNRAVVLLSSMHHDDAVNAEQKNKPQIVLDYNDTKGGVDTADQLVRTYSVLRKVKRWPVVCFFNLLDIAALNALIIWIMNDPTWEGRKKYRRRLFLKQLARSLVTPWITARANKPQSRQVRRAILAAGFEITASEREEVVGTKRRCYLCGKKKDRKTQYRCNGCHKPVCLSHCSTHTQYKCVSCQEENS